MKSTQVNRYDLIDKTIVKISNSVTMITINKATKKLANTQISFPQFVKISNSMTITTTNKNHEKTIRKYANISSTVSQTVTKAKEGMSSELTAVVGACGRGDIDLHWIALVPLPRVRVEAHGCTARPVVATGVTFPLG